MKIERRAMRVGLGEPTVRENLKGNSICLFRNSAGDSTSTGVIFTNTTKQWKHRIQVNGLEPSVCDAACRSLNNAISDGILPLEA